MESLEGSNKWLFRVILIGVFLFLAQLYQGQYVFYSRYYLKPIATMTLIVTVGAYLYNHKIRSTRSFWLAMSLSMIFLMINGVLVARGLSMGISKINLAKLQEQMRTCESAQTQFENDLKNGNVRYFTSGMGEDEDYNDSMKSTYDLEVYHLGCVMVSGFTCYNELVEKVVIN